MSAMAVEIQEIGDLLAEAGRTGVGADVRAARDVSLVQVGVGVGADRGCGCAAGPMDVVWDDVRSDVRPRVCVRGDDVHMARARQAAAAMCLVCWSRRSGGVKAPGGVCVKAKGEACAGLAACPAGKWTRGVWRRVRWAGCVCKGVPKVVRWALWARGLRPRAGAWSGCGCSVWGLMRLRWLQRRFPALRWGARRLG